MWAKMVLLWQSLVLLVIQLLVPSVGVQRRNNMKNFKIIFFALIALSSQTINAREIMGLKFCETVSVADIKKSIEENKSIVSEEKTDEATGVISIETKNYKIVDVTKKVEFSIYKNKLYKITINDSSIIDDLLDAKYGLLRQERKSDLGIMEREIFYYNIKDKDIDLFKTYQTISIGSITSSGSYITYLCKPIDNMLTFDKDKAKKQQQLQKKDANKL